MLSVFFVLFLASGAIGQIVDDMNCTVYDAAATPDPGMVYTERAVICSDVAATSTCNVLFQDDPTDPVILAAGSTDPRPVKCWGPAAGQFDAGLNKLAREQCPRTCGLCCMSPEYNCDNVRFPRINCATITAAQCRDATWRPIIAADCPAACGLCNAGGCVDAVIECANDRSICNAVGMQDFVNTNCQRTCGRCSSTTAATGTGTGTCTTYIPNSSSACASWAANGFCTNTFYTVAQRRAYCATTCRIC